MSEKNDNADLLNALNSVEEVKIGDVVRVKYLPLMMTSKPLLVLKAPVSKVLYHKRNFNKAS